MQVEIDAIRVDVREAGAGRPIVLVHGYPFDGAMWSAVARHLADRFRVVKPDLPGHGENPAAARRRMTELADFVETILASLSDHAGVAGFSMGGYVVLELARRRPAALAALALVDTRAAADDLETRAQREQSIARIQREGVQPVADAMPERLLAPGSLVNGELVQRVRRVISRQPPETLAADLEAMRDRADSTEFVREIRVPTLVVVGEHDSISPPEECRRLAASIPGARLEIISAAGHLTPMEQPRLVARALGEFFGESLATRRAEPPA